MKNEEITRTIEFDVNLEDAELFDKLDTLQYVSRNDIFKIILEEVKFKNIVSEYFDFETMDENGGVPTVDIEDEEDMERLPYIDRMNDDIDGMQVIDVNDIDGKY